MLEIKNLTKIYRPKKGVPVVALDRVSLKLPEKGMVFLLGKSGCGKSTFLNLLGGLDKYDNGEIIIKGVSSKKFKQKHFDSYRNTYVGFIFQEYNILEDFTVGANIALAIELQGRKATDEELNGILKEVDLAGYGGRRPNELSGGQKQRVAIARALVKNPKIIMADEPSGALDSVTGKQVFDTLKKLSADKLVIVVSHDRDFANEYADRIIELADGRVISDTAVSQEESVCEEGVIFQGNTAKITAGYHLTEEDRIAINEYMDKINSGLEIESVSKTENKRFKATDEEKIVYSDNSPFKLIKSKLSLKHAFKIGASGLKHKKFRLAMTIFLSCIAFVLFGLVDTFSAYDHISATADSIYDSGIKYATISKQIRHVEEDDYEFWINEKITDADITQLENATGVKFKGVVTLGYSGFNFSVNLAEKDTDLGYSPFYDLTTDYFSGMVEVNQGDLDEKHYKIIAGRTPDGSKDEILISKYIFSCFQEKGYKVAGSDKAVKINNEADILGKKLMMNGAEYEIVGVIDTNLNMERYKAITEKKDDEDAADTIIDYVLYEEFNSAVENDYTGMMMVGDGFIERYFNSSVKDIYGENKSIAFFTERYYLEARLATRLDTVDKNKIKWLGEPKDSLGEKEIIITDRILTEAGISVLTNEDGSVTVDEEQTKKLNLQCYFEDYSKYDYTYGIPENETLASEGEYKIVGYILSDYSFDNYDDSTVVLSDGMFEKFFPKTENGYNRAIGTMPDNKRDIEKFAKVCYGEEDGIKYPLRNPASFELDAMDEILDVLADVFLYIGIGFAVFAAILLSNFIATSISYKKQEIGILRAIGSRGNDVFRIFFAEAFIIAMINFVLACLLTGGITAVINEVLRQDVGLLITVLHFGIRQILVVLAVSVGVAAVASFLPVKKIASKRPIDAIKNI
ncbi:MAG: ABC transporter ATP-binding protein/permease [Ruminococcaceae bacterium]|nr:ABC transporter ATP-binding protein/permease [Oscillospiraceae bacterium]